MFRPSSSPWNDYALGLFLAAVFLMLALYVAELETELVRYRRLMRPRLVWVSGPHAKGAAPDEAAPEVQLELKLD